MNRTGNELRDTPGRMMLLWAALLLPLVIFAWRVRLGGGDYDWVEYPTALGDRAYYTAMIGENDLLEPNLRFTGHEKGLFRRQFDPRPRDDASMRKIEREATGRHFVYTDSKPRADKQARYYLKTAENSFIEFGERKYYPADPGSAPVPKAVPVTAPPQ
jgi:hypothetical protein